MIEKNLQWQLQKEKRKLDQALEGLDKVLQIVGNSDWNPYVGPVAMEVVVTVENALREVESVK